MKGLWLEHYCYGDLQPLKNIMRLPREEAFSMAEKLSDTHPETTAFYRFKDFENYYPRRLKTDALLHDMFCALGGKPKEKHPLSFVLGGSEYLFRWFGEGKLIRIPLEGLPEEQVSFTLGDSMSTLERHGTITMLTLSELQEKMKAHEQGMEGWLQEMQEKYTYIEVQVWDDAAIPAGDLKE